MSWRSLALVCQNTFRTHCLCRPLLCAAPNSAATSSSNALRQRSFLSWVGCLLWQPSSFMLPYAMAIHLAPTSANDKVTRPRMHLKRFVKLQELKTGGEGNLLLSFPKTWWQGSSHSWDSHFFHKSHKVGQPSSFMLPYAMALPSCLLVSVGGRCSQRPGPHAY